ncbi:MAG: hypothetical protein SFU83_23970 [Meiothermus sp.]|nr:hypothetical protein [Meiothermus sp.]
MIWALLFTVGAIVVTWLLYVALRPANMERGGEGDDLRFIGFALVLIILSAITIASMLILGKSDVVQQIRF